MASLNNFKESSNLKDSYFPTIVNKDYIKSLPQWKQNSLSYRTRLPKLKQESLQFKGHRNTTQSLGPFSLGISQDMYKKLNPPETALDLSLKRSVIRINDNSDKFTWKHNPFERVVNSSIEEDILNPVVSFRSKAIYERAVELSLKPGNNTRDDRQNPIYFFIPNTNEYRYYKSWEK